MTSTVADDRIQILAQDDGDAIARQSRPREHQLDEERIAEHGREIEADDGERRDQRRAERVAVGDAPLRETVGLRHFDIGLGVGLDHVGAREPRRLPNACERQRESRQQHVPKRVAEGPEIAGEQRVEEQEVGARGHDDRVRDAARDREQRQKIGEQQHQDHRPDEGRRRYAEQRDEPDDIVRPAVAIARRQDAERQSEADHHQAGDKDELQGGWQELGDVRRDGSVGVERDAEIAVQQFNDEVAVLFEDRSIEMQFLAQRRDLVRRRVGPERDARGIARNHTGDGENQHGNPDQHDQRGS